MPPPPHRILICTGEVSGDLQGSLLVKALQDRSRSQGLALDIVALGGDRMAAAGARLLGNTSAIGSIGLLESLPYVVPTLLLQRRVQQYLRQSPPDMVVLIDYVGPNLALAQLVHRRYPTLPVIYYIAPQEWVWSFGSRNTAQVVKSTHEILAIFPEEARYYGKRGANVTWVGHPLVDRLHSAPSRATARESLGIAPDQLVISLLPASRRQELKYLMPVIFEAAQRIQTTLSDTATTATLPFRMDPDRPLFWIPLSLSQYRPAIAAALRHYGLNACIVDDRNQEVLAAADLAITKSGTVNLELALLEVPQVVLYRVSPLTAWIARHVLRFSIPFMCPANLVEMKPIVPEFLQEQATPKNLATEALSLLFQPDRYNQMRQDYRQMRACLGEPGVCDRAAQEILKYLM